MANQVKAVDQYFPVAMRIILKKGGFKCCFCGRNSEVWPSK